MARRYQQSLLEDKRDPETGAGIPADSHSDGDRDLPDTVDEDEDDAALIGLKDARWGLTPKGIRELARKHSAAAVRRIVHLMKHSSNHRVQLAAAEAILNRAFGHPAQEVKFSDGDNPEEIQRRRDALDELAHRPEYLAATVELLQKVGVLMPGDPNAVRPTIKPVDDEHHPSYQVVSQLDTPAPPAPELSDEERQQIEEGQECAAERCRHALRTHPGGAACEACPCPVFTREEEPREVTPEVVA